MRAAREWCLRWPPRRWDDRQQREAHSRDLHRCRDFGTARPGGWWRDSEASPTSSEIQSVPAPPNPETAPRPTGTWADLRPSRKRPPDGARRSRRCRNWRTAATVAYPPCAAPRAQPNDRHGDKPARLAARSGEAQKRKMQATGRDLMKASTVGAVLGFACLTLPAMAQQNPTATQVTTQTIPPEQ